MAPLRPVATTCCYLSHLSPCLIGHVPARCLQYTDSQQRQDFELFSPVSSKQQRSLYFWKILGNSPEGATPELVASAAMTQCEHKSMSSHKNRHCCADCIQGGGLCTLQNMSNAHLGDGKASWIGSGWQWDGKLVCKEPSD